MFCIPKELRNKFVKALKDGSLDIDKLADEPKTQVRRTELEKVFGKDYAKTANIIIEKGLLKPDQEAGLIQAVKTLALEPEKEADFIKKISDINTKLYDGEAILQDAREAKLNINISDNQAKSLVELSRKLDQINPENRNEVKNINDLVDLIENMPGLTDLQKADIEGIKTELNTTKKPEEISKDIKIKINTGNNEISSNISELARYFVEKGITNPEELSMAVHSVLKDIIPDITPRETMDAISGYGKYRQLSKDEINLKLSDLKGQMQNLSKLQDMEKGQAPLKSGVERTSMSDELRRLIQKVNEAKKKGGYDVRDPEIQLKSSLEIIKTHLKNEIADLEQQIKTGEKIIKEKGLSPSDAEVVNLKQKKAELKKQFDNIFGKKELTDNQRISIANKTLDRSIAKLELELKQGNLYPEKTTKPSLSTPELDAKRTILESLKAQREELRNIFNPKMSAEEKAMSTYKAQTTAKIAELQAKIDAGDFSKTNKEQKPKIYDNEALNFKADLERLKNIINEVQKENKRIETETLKKSLGSIQSYVRKTFGKNVPPEIQDKLTNLTNIYKEGKNKEYAATKVAVENYIESLRGPEESVKELIIQAFEDTKEQWKTNKPKAVFDLLMKTTKVMVDNSIVLVASIDNSFIGRQGLKVLMTRPTVWYDGAINSFKDFAGTLGGKNMRDALLTDIYAKENYINGNYEIAKILSKSEEQFPTSLPGKIPALGRLFKASEAAFEGSAMRMRTGLYDLISDMAQKNGVDMTQKYQIESIGTIINSLTARGQWGKRGESPIVKLILWAPKMLKGNIDVLTAHLGQDISPFARKQAAINLTKIVMTSATIMTLANAIKPGSAELDPRSSNFGKIKLGNTTYDFTGGASSLVVLAARQISGSTKSSSTGLIKEFGTEFGQQTRFDSLIDFLTGKTTPPIGAMISFMKGTTPTGDRATLGNVAKNILLPISIQNAIKLKDDSSANAILGVILDGFGINASTYVAGSTDWTKNMGVELKAFQAKVGNVKFEQANDLFNKEVTEWLISTKNNVIYQKLSPEDKQRAITNKKDDIKTKIFRQYGFRYRKAKSNRIPNF